jgi:hypothetical protein
MLVVLSDLFGHRAGVIIIRRTGLTERQQSSGEKWEIVSLDKPFQLLKVFTLKGQG